MFGDVMRSGLKFAAAIAVLVVGATSASAFEETRGGGAVPPAAAVAPTTPGSQTPGLKLELGGTGTSVAPSTGTEVRIPGLGKLGILPKLDFGLELLYGVNEQTLERPGARGADQGEDSVGIRGTLRHRF
jgi:hypothetical protein